MEMLAAQQSTPVKMSSGAEGEVGRFACGHPSTRALRLQLVMTGNTRSHSREG